MLTKKLISKYIVLFLFSLVLTACKNDKNKTKEIDLNRPSQKTLRTSINDFGSKIRTITPNEAAKYKNNLQIVSGESTFDNVSQKINLKIPVANGNYRALEKHDVSSSTITAILYVITDNTRNAVLSENMTHILEDEFDMSFIDGEQVKNKKLVVFVVNDFPEDFDSYRSNVVRLLESEIQNGNTSIDCEALKAMFVRPKEACGGIIVAK